MSRVEEVVERISEAIQLGLLDDGEKLPTEPSLAKQFAVAPMTVREALATLRDRGLVETRRGRTGGSFIKIPSEPLLDSLRARLRHMTTFALRDFADEQVAITSQAARLAAERASATNIRQLFGFTEQLNTAESINACVRADSRFHIELAVAAQSERLTRAEVRLQSEVAGMLWLPGEPEMDIDAHVAEHHAIAGAIAAEDAHESGGLASEHVGRNLMRLTTLRLELGGSLDGK